MEDNLVQINPVERKSGINEVRNRCRTAAGANRRCRTCGGQKVRRRGEGQVSALPASTDLAVAAPVGSAGLAGPGNGRVGHADGAARNASVLRYSAVEAARVGQGALEPATELATASSAMREVLTAAARAQARLAHLIVALRGLGDAGVRGGRFTASGRDRAP